MCVCLECFYFISEYLTERGDDPAFESLSIPDLAALLRQFFNKVLALEPKMESIIVGVPT